jgi:hypothetical protein
MRLGKNVGQRQYDRLSALEVKAVTKPGYHADGEDSTFKSPQADRSRGFFDSL